jgi:GT2 family glycosyltransferase
MLDITVIIVTYSNRFNLVEQVVDSILSENINNIIVIDNNSDIESKDKLKVLEVELKEKLKVIYLPENIGSAGGFKRGLEEAYKSNCDFIWVFDDDNVAKKGALKALFDCWNNLKLDEAKDMLISLRADRKQYYKSIEHNNKELLTGTKNSFMTFDFLSYLKNKFLKKATIEKYNKNFGEVGQAPYGGMFLHKKLINNIAYPNEDFFVYTDDTEYSYRVIKNGGKIYAVLNSLLEDIDTSWHDVELEKGIFISPILETPSNFRVYYSFRNRIYFELNNRVENKLVYFTNMFIFMSRLFISSFFRIKFKRFILLLRAIRDGINGNLGERNF